MTATFTHNKQTGLAATWWLYKGGIFGIQLVDTTGAASPPPNTTPLLDWITPIDYSVSPAPDSSELQQLQDTGGNPAYGTTITNQAELPQLQFDINFPTYGGPITYTHIVVFCVLAADRQGLWVSGDPAEPYLPTIAVIEESPAITLQTTETKTYKLDLWADGQT